MHGLEARVTVRDANVLSAALLDVLPDDGMPWSYAVLAAEQAGIANPGDVVLFLVEIGLVSIAVGHRLVPGREWARVKATYTTWKGGA